MRTLVTRAQRVKQIDALRARGLSRTEIAAELGLKAATVRAFVNDPDGAKDRARKARYAGVCVECGGPTSGSNGTGKAPVRCVACVRGVPIGSSSRPTARRTVPVRLDELPLDVRLDGVRQANRIEQGEHERREILIAALFPSETVYFIAESARPLLDELRATAREQAA
jgi:hypothetical protein